MHDEENFTAVENRSHTISEGAVESDEDIDLALWFQVHLQTHKKGKLMLLNRIILGAYTS